MPSKTFLSLPEAKQQLFINTAISIFSKNCYSTASITELVKRTGIAKGSFYQYFQHKLDLYQYLVEKVSILLQAQIEKDCSKTHTLEEFAYCRMSSILEFCFSNMNYAKLLHFFMCDVFHPEIGSLCRKRHYAVKEIWNNAVLQEKEQGNVKKKTDSTALAELLCKMELSIFSNLYTLNPLDLEDLQNARETCENQVALIFKGTLK
ncbi:MAG: TetR/AcrR family transcriptional regulator [Luteibaculaceae bacterium]